MKFNLHTHTYRCHHAEGTDEDYVLKAIEQGYDMIGFSDHAPYIFPSGHYSGFRMETSLAEDYAKSIKALKEKYKDKIDIKLGFEVEWYPELIEKEIEYLKSFDYDYINLAQHYTDNEYEPWAKYTGSKTGSIETLDKYIEQLLQGARSGYFTYVCHPDLINFTGDKELYKQKMEYMIRELKAIGIPLEYNFYGYYDKRHYPNDVFWKIVKEVGCDVVIGLDAHFPCVYEDKRLDKMKKHIDSLGLKPLEEIKLIK